MPFRGACGAPTFDPSDPETIHRYLDDLEHLFRRFRILDEVKRLDYAVYYVPQAAWKQWKALAQSAATFSALKTEVMRIVPEDVETPSLVPIQQLITLLQDAEQHDPFKTLKRYQAFLSPLRA